MPQVSAAPRYETMADLFARVGEMAPERIRVTPPPGKATEADLLRLNRKTNKLYELIDGILVEKVMGFLEGGLALDIAYLLRSFMNDHDLGDLVGADATMRLMPGLVRLPDVSFVSWDKLPGRQRPVEPIPDLVPDLAIEVLSQGNTPGEMRVKLKDYFLAGVVLVWLVDPHTRSVTVHTAPDQHTTFQEGETLDGGDILPGLQLAVKDIFARVPSAGIKPKKATSKRKPKA